MKSSNHALLRSIAVCVLIVIRTIAAYASASATVASAAEPIVTSGLHFTPVYPAEYAADFAKTTGLGFNLVWIRNVAELNGLPAGACGLVWNPYCTGLTDEFKNKYGAYKGNPKLWGFYIIDEPTPDDCPVANLKAESDWIHANIPGAKTFAVLFGSSQPYAAYAAAVDLVGLDPYPCGGDGECNYNSISDFVNSVISAGVPREKIIPVYQAHSWQPYLGLPTAAQARQILATWAALTPTPVFDYAYAWHWDGGLGIKESPQLQEVFKEHNATGHVGTGTSGGATGGGTTQFPPCLN